jgi:hypothetical protein
MITSLISELKVLMSSFLLDEVTCHTILRVSDFPRPLCFSKRRIMFGSAVCVGHCDPNNGKRMFVKTKKVFSKFNYFTVTLCGSGSSVGITTDYGLSGPGIESRRGRDFSHTSRPVLGPTQPSV